MISDLNIFFFLNILVLIFYIILKTLFNVINFFITIEIILVIYLLILIAICKLLYISGVFPFFIFLIIVIILDSSSFLTGIIKYKQNNII